MGERRGLQAWGTAEMTGGEDKPGRKCEKGGERAIQAVSRRSSSEQLCRAARRSGELRSQPLGVGSPWWEQLRGILMWLEHWGRGSEDSKCCCSFKDSSLQGNKKQAEWEEDASRGSVNTWHS